MILERRIRLILHSILLISILVFYLIAEVPQFFIEMPETIVQQNNYYRLSNLRRIIGITVSIVIVMSFFRWQKLTILMFWLFNEKYIGGIYKGYSQKIVPSHNGKKEQEYVEIKQTLFHTKITGKSTGELGEFKASYYGDLHSNQIDNYKFLVTLETSDNEHIGVMSLKFSNGEAQGYAISVETEKNAKWKFELVKE